MDLFDERPNPRGTSGTRARNNPPNHPTRHSAILKPAALSPIRAKRAGVKKESNKRGTNPMGAGTASTRRVTRSRTAQAANAAPQEEASAKVTEAPNTTAKSPKSAARGKKKPTAEPIPATSETPPETPKPKAKRTRQAVRFELAAEAEQAAEPDQAPAAEDAEITVRTVPGLAATTTNSKAAPRTRRPKAADFYETVDTPTGGSQGSTSKKTKTGAQQEHRWLPPVTPQIPWELYGMSDTESDPKPRAVVRREKKGPKPSSDTAAPAEPASRDDHPTANDPHDKTMDEDYIPTGPGPLPSVPKLLKSAKKRARKQPPSALTTSRTAPSPQFPDPALADTPFPFPSTLPSPPPHPFDSLPPLRLDAANEADPGIWNLGTHPTPQHWIMRPAPPRRGNVYCETCFRDDLARWARLRDAVVRILFLLGGDEALAELRVLSREVEEAEREEAEKAAARHARRGRSGGESRRGGGSGRLRSPPPPEYQEASSDEEEEEGEEEDAKPVGKATRGRKTKGKEAGKGKGKGTAKGRAKGRLTAKKLIVVADDGFRTWESPHFNEYQVEIVGLVLLRVLAERPTTAVSEAKMAEVKQMLEGLRQDIGIGPKLFDAMTALCKAMVLRRRVKEPFDMRSVRPAGENEKWWWEFDDALQAASSQLPATKEPSFFAGTLAKKANAAADAALRAREAATAQTGDDSCQVGSLARLEQTLGLTVPSNVFLKTIGEKLAQARQDLLNTASAAQPPTSTTQSKRKQPPSGPSSPPKRRKPSPEEPQSTINPTLLSNEAPSDEPVPLPCTYCSESTASLYRYYAQRRTARLGADNSGTTPELKPWTHPLMWSFHLPLDAANRITKADDWFRMVASSRDVRVVQVPEPDTGLPAVVKFMVDVMGGKTRIVLMELKDVFEIALERDQTRVRFEMPTVVMREDPMNSAWRNALGLARPVGRWENWRGGRLEGFSEV